MSPTLGRHRVRYRLIIPVCVVLIATLGPLAATPAAVPAQGSVYPLTVLVLVCDDDPGYVEATAPRPRNCEPVAGGAVSAERTDGSRVDRCETSADGRCVLLVPTEERVLVAEEPSTIRRGYRALRNPQSRAGDDAGSGLTFVNVPDPVAPGETANVTIHYRVCPDGYDGDDLFGDCHGNPGAFTRFRLDGPWPSERATGDDGNVTFAELPPGDYVISGGRSSDFATFSFFCSYSWEPGVPIAWDQLGRGSYARLGLSLTAGDDVICDWYVIAVDLAAAGDPSAPVRSTVVIVFAWLCPRGLPEEIDIASCREPWRGTNFRFSNADPTDTWRTVQADGNGVAAIEVTYRNLPYRIVADGQATLGWYEVICVGGDDRVIPVTYLRVGIAIDDLRDGEEIACDWYFMPAPLADSEARG